MKLKTIFSIILCLSILLGGLQTNRLVASSESFSHETGVYKILAVSHNVFQYGSGRKITAYICGEFWPDIFITDSKNKIVVRLKSSVKMIHAVTWDGKDKNGKYVKSGIYKFKVRVGMKAIYHRFVVKNKLSKSDIIKNKYFDVSLIGFNLKIPSNWTINYNQDTDKFFVRSPKKGNSPMCTVGFNIYDFRSTSLTKDYIKTEYENYINQEYSNEGNIVKKFSSNLSKTSGSMYQLELVASLDNGLLASDESSFLASVEKYFFVKDNLGYEVNFVTKKDNTSFDKYLADIRKSIVFNQIGESSNELVARLEGDIDFGHLKTTIPTGMHAIIYPTMILYQYGVPINNKDSLTIHITKKWGTLNDETVVVKRDFMESGIMPDVTPVITDTTFAGIPAKLVLAKKYDESNKNVIEYGTYLFRVQATTYSLDYKILLDGDDFSKDNYNDICQSKDELLNSINVY